MCKDEGLDGQKTQAILDHYVSTGRIPRDHDLDNVLIKKPSILQRESIVQKIKARIMDFINTFIEDM